MDVPLLDYLSSMSPNRAGRIGLVVWQRNGLKVSGHHPTFYMSQAIRWGQGCSRSNKAGSHCITSSFLLDTNLMPSSHCPSQSTPLLIGSLWDEPEDWWWQVCRHTLCGTPVGLFILNSFDFLSVRLCWEGGWDRFCPRVTGYMKGSGLYLAKKKKKKKDVLKQFSVVFRNNRKSL